MLLLLALLGLFIWLSLSSDKTSLQTADIRSATKALEGFVRKSEEPLYEDYRFAPETEEEKHLAVVTPPTAADKAINTPEKRHGIAIIIDDMGHDRDAARRILALPYPVALSILPDEPHAKFTANAAWNAGHSVMLHLPMEPENGHYTHRMNGSFLRASMPSWQRKKLLLNALNRVPHVSGINNHMGSKLTAHRPSMREMMRILKQKKLFFIDSRTTKETVAAIEAERAGIRWNRRHVFLDHIVDADAIRSSWQQAIKRHQRGENLIVIGHPHLETLHFLEHGIDQEVQKIIIPVTSLLNSPS